MDKKKIIITAAAGLVSFAGAFALAMFLPSETVAEEVEVAQMAVKSNVEVEEVFSIEEDSYESGYNRKDKAAQKKLNKLVFDVRSKMEEYNNKLRTLERQEERLQMSHDMLKEDIEALNSLRLELVSTVTSLKNERDKLLKSRIAITKTEKENLATIAATYDKMDSASASKILSKMVSLIDEDGGGFTDAIKILHYMNARKKAKLLAELVTNNSELAAIFSKKLKRISIEE